MIVVVDLQKLQNTSVLLSSTHVERASELETFDARCGSDASEDEPGE